MAKFKQGQSGNPAGRRPGVPNRTTKLRALLEPHAEELVSKAVELAKSGDSAALRLCIERLIPAFRSEPRLQSMPSLENEDSLTNQGRGILRALSDGSISAADAHSLLKALGDFSRLVETDELVRRVTALEAQDHEKDSATHRRA